MTSGEDGAGDRPIDPQGLAMTLAPDTTLAGILVPDEAGGGVREGSLLVIGGASADIGTHVLVGDEVVIGRAAEGLRLRDGRTSRRHCRVWRDEEGYRVEDLRSTNGTTLGVTPLRQEPQPLHDGSKIYLGNTTLKFTIVDDTEAAYLQRMARLASTDALTGLHAKHRFDAMLDEALETAQRTSTPLAVLMMDMDGLKAINDAHGHRMGAHTIAQVGKRIGALLHRRGEACRFGGDEFCAYLTTSDLLKALNTAEEIRQSVSASSFELDGVSVEASISIGVAQASEAASTSEQLVSAADKALYRAKGKGRNCVSD